MSKDVRLRLRLSLRHSPRNTGIVCLAMYVAGLTACAGQVTAVALHAPPRPVSPHGFESVTVYSGAPPLRPHVAIARLNLDRASEPNEQGANLMIHRLRERAGTLGCDGVVIGGLGDPDGKSVDATCIVYK